MQRTRRALGVGLAVCSLYLVTAALTHAFSGGSVRPLYEGPCPPTVCPPCPPSCPTYAPTPTPATPPPQTNPPRTPAPTAASGATAPPVTSGAPASPVTAPGGPTAPPSATPPPAVGVIGSVGGTATSSNGELEIVVPPGALMASAVFRIVAVTAPPQLPAGRGLASAVWDATAAENGVPVTVFDKPLELIVHYSASPASVIATWDGAEWVNLPTVVDAKHMTATASAPHLTPVVAFVDATSPFVALGGGVEVPVTAVVVLVIGAAIVAGTTYFVRTRLQPVGTP